MPDVVQVLKPASRLGYDLTSLFRFQKNLSQDVLTTLGRDSMRNHSHHAHCTYGDELVGSRRGTLQALFCGPERITKGLEPGEHPSERSGAITTLFWSTESICTKTTVTRNCV